jgi:hypothetical protein
MNALFQSNASIARYHRASGQGVDCLCRTPEGFRDPEFHLSFGRYGPQDYEFAPGVIDPVNPLLEYFFTFTDPSFVPMSPARTITVDSSSQAGPFSVKINLEPPPKPGLWLVWRTADSHSMKFLQSMNTFGTTIFTDNTPVAGGLDVPVYVEPVICNEAGQIALSAIDISVKAFVQPIQSTRATRLSTEYLQEVFGNIEADDHLGIFPVNWSGQRLEFHNWAQDGSDFIDYDGQRFLVINANMIPDPGDGNPEHHWEVGLRLLRSDGLVS